MASYKCRHIKSLSVRLEQEEVHLEIKRLHAKNLILDSSLSSISQNYTFKDTFHIAQAPGFKDSLCIKCSFYN